MCAVHCIYVCSYVYLPQVNDTAVDFSHLYRHVMENLQAGPALFKTLFWICGLI